MTRLTNLIAGFGLSLLLAGCAANESAESTSMSADLCRQVARLSQDAKRNSFSLDYPGAERGFRRIVALYNDEPELAECDIPVSPAQAHMNLGLVLSNQRRYVLADVSFQTAANLLDGKKDPVAISDRAQLGAYLQQHELNRNDTVQVRDYAQQTLALLDRIKSGDAAVFDDGTLFGVDQDTQSRRIAEAQTYYALGFADLSEAKIDGVEERSLRAIDLIKSFPSSGLRARFALQQAVAQSAKRQWALAARTAQGAAKELEETVANSPLLARALLVQATALSRTGDRELAYQIFEQAFSVYEEAPVGLSYETIWPFVDFVTEGVRRGERTEEERAELIFRAGQLVRGPFTAYDIAAAAAIFEAGSGPQAQAVRAWRAAENRLGRLRGAQSQVDRLLPEQRVELERQIADAADDEAELRARRDELAPGYSDAINAPVTIGNVQGLLGEDELLVQILTGNPRSTVIAVGSNETVVRTVNLPSGLLRQLGLRNQTEFFDLAVNVMRESFTVRNGRYPPFAADIANAMHEILFSGLDAQFEGKSRVFITTNGVLQSIPLDLLVTENPAPLAAQWTNDDYSGLAWMGDKYELSYLPSPRNLVDIRSRASQSAAPNPVLAFGGFESTTTARSVLDRAGLPDTCRQAASVIAGLEPLPQSGVEVDRIVNVMGPGARQVTGAEFTEENVAALANDGVLKDYQVLHFATHGLVWPIEDCFTEPALVTSVGPGATSDGLLSSSEIRQMELDAQFVVLSACDTVGIDGNLQISGENLSGLARAFFSSGARSVMASHWKVDDAVTAEIMSDMYARLAASPGKGFGEALREARVAVRATPGLSHPALWAAFVVIGDSTLGLVPRSNDS